MPSQIDLEQELRELGRTLVVAPPPDDLAERVLVRVRTEGPRRGRISTWWQWLTGSRRRLVAAIVAACLSGWYSPRQYAPPLWSGSASVES